MKISDIAGCNNREKNFQSFTLEIEEFIVTLTVSKDDKTIQQLNEAKQKGNITLGGIYSAALHKVPPPGKTHLHVFAKNNQLFAINIDGSAHDDSHKIQIPNKVANAIKNQFPDFILPPNNYIESVERAINISVNMEILLG